jgi:ABC-type dipeptide/oligopeptide/nickel transport system permease component
MLRFVLNEAGRLLLSLFGAALMSSAIATLSVPHAGDGVLQFFLAWGLRLNRSAHLQFGLSSITGLPIASELTARLPLTLGLVLEGMAAAALIGIPIGFLFGAGPVRRAAAPLIQIVAAAPVFCAGLALAYLSANPPSWPAPIGDGVRFGLKILPQTAAHAPATLLPALTVGLAGAAAVQLALRRAAAETARESWRIYLQRMGLLRWEIEGLYVVPQIFAGLLAHLGEVMLALLSASAVAEWVFSCPGAADLFVKSVALHDWSVAGAILFVFATLTLTAEFLGRCAARPMIDRGTST